MRFSIGNRRMQTELFRYGVPNLEIRCNASVPVCSFWQRTRLPYWLARRWVPPPGPSRSRRIRPVIDVLGGYTVRILPAASVGRKGGPLSSKDVSSYSGDVPRLSDCSGLNGAIFSTIFKLDPDYTHEL